MQFTDFIIIILLTSCVLIWFTNLIYKCPVKKSIPIPERTQIKYSPELDLQFDERNFPSKIYSGIFSSPNIYMGGYNLDQGKSIIKK